jgi:hypothetical protein
MNFHWFILGVLESVGRLAPVYALAFALAALEGSLGLALAEWKKQKR